MADFKELKITVFPGYISKPEGIYHRLSMKIYTGKEEYGFTKDIKKDDMRSMFDLMMEHAVQTLKEEIFKGEQNATDD